MWMLDFIIQWNLAWLRVASECLHWGVTEQGDKR